MSVLYLLPLANDDNPSIISISVGTVVGTLIFAGFVCLAVFLWVKYDQSKYRRNNLDIDPQSIQVTTQRMNHA